MSVGKAFIERLLPAPKNGGFRMDEWWVWCGSVVRGPDARYHMFAARWPKTYRFFEGYQCYSEVVRATSPTPEGPYALEEVVLPTRGPEFWDGMMTHNPTIHKSGDRYLLFYIGATYEPPGPTAQELLDGTSEKPRQSYATVRIGMASAPAPEGPWTRPDRPILEPRPGKWDGSVVTNPAPCVLDDGRILMVYRSNTPQGLRLGAAMADNWRSPFHRVREEPILADCDAEHFVEDPCIWQTAEGFEMIAKDIPGKITGEVYAGAHATSKNGLDWTFSERPKAYSRTVRWDDGSQTTQGCVERPQLLFDDQGRPTHMFAATADGPGGFRHALNTWNMVIPLATD